MGSPSAVITLGLGAWGAPAVLVTLGLGFTPVVTVLGSLVGTATRGSTYPQRPAAQ